MNSFSIEPRKEADGKALSVAPSTHSAIRLSEGWQDARKISVNLAEIPIAEQRVAVSTEVSPVKKDPMMLPTAREPYQNDVPGQDHVKSQDSLGGASGGSTDYDFSSTGEDSSNYEFQSDGDDAEEVWEDTTVSKRQKSTMTNSDEEMGSEEAFETEGDDSDEVYGQRRRKRAQPRRRFKGGKRITRVRPRQAREPIAVSDEENEEYTSDDSNGDAEHEEYGEGHYLETTTLIAENPFEIPFARPEEIPLHVDKIMADRNNGQEFLVKWRRLSHWHDTWEREDRICAFAGARKLDNYRIVADRDELDVEEFKVIERIIDEYHDHAEEDEQKVEAEAGTSTFYLCKWAGLPYSECTWEPRADVIKENIMKVDEYVVRSQSGGIPTCGKTWNRRCAFRKLAQTPAYITQYGELRDYQLEGVNWLLYSWCHGTNVILADEMGLGKTIQSIAFISALYHEYGFTGPVLVVVPLSTISAWQREFSRWAPSLSTLLYIGDSHSRGIQRYYEWFAEENAAESISRGTHRRNQETGRDGRPWPLFHVLLTTFELVLKDKEYLREVDWRMLLVDEGHRLKNASSQLHEVLDQLSPTSRLLVTGTPLQNSLLELWSLLHFLMPIKFSDYDDFLERYGPPQSSTCHPNDADVRLERLHKILKPHLLRRMKKDVETSIPAKIERILRVEMTEQQKTLSRLIITKNYRELASHSKAVGSLNNILIELKKVCNHPLLREEANGASLDELLRGSGKMALLDQLLMRLHRDGHRVLIFSQMVRMLDILSNYLTLRGFSFQRLDGATSSEERKRSIAVFNAVGSLDFCFLLSTRAGGLGINLETADTVIIYDSDWNPQNDLQAMARAHRIGQRRSVNIYRLVCKSSVEETILERAKQKMILDHLVIQSMDTSGRRDPARGGLSEGSAKRITRDELDAILKFGAQDLFKASETTQSVEGNTDTKLAEVDLDEILARADSNSDSTAERSNLGSEQFFDQFKVAEFGPMKEWDEILPSDEVIKAKKEIADDNAQKREIALQEALLTSASKRRRPALSNVNDTQRFMGNRQLPFKGTKVSSKFPPSKRSSVPATDCTSDDRIKLTKEVTRTLITSLLRFGCLVKDRFDVIVADVVAENEGSKRGDISSAGIKEENLLHAMQVIRRKIEESQEESCKLSNSVHVNLTQLRERHKILYFLQRRLAPLYPDRLSHFVITERGIKSVSAVGARRWMIEWRTPEDDAKLLVGVYRHGFGRWREIANDPTLGLEKLKESLIDKEAEEKFLPKDLHLARRVENVLIHMMLDACPVGGPGGKRKLARMEESTTEGMEGVDDAKTLVSPINGNYNKADTSKEMFKRLLKPVREDIAFIASLTAETFPENLDKICDSLLRVGLHIQREDEGADDEHLWRYLASFWPTEISGRELKHLYDRISKERSAKQVMYQ